MESTRRPACVGIIMDGNRRFARERGLPTLEGHRLGYAKAKEVANWCREAGLSHLILYAFSTENWNRSPEEVAYLTNIFKTVLFEEAQSLRNEGGAVRFIGALEQFGPDVAARARELESENPAEPSITLVIALSYGGRAEIVAAANRLLAEGKKSVTQQEFEDYLMTKGVPDPDIIIRTSGERRLSNFLPWQSVYSELFFTPTYWPAFTKEEFTTILNDYAKRERRMGA